MTLKDRIIAHVTRFPGQTDREITDVLQGHGKPQQSVNQTARLLEAEGVLERRPRADGLIGNYLSGKGEASEPMPEKEIPKASRSADGLSEDEVKRFVKDWLERDGWSVTVAWGRQRGIDIEATRGEERWLIEAKGCGSRPEMRVNYFIAMLGELLQRMDDPEAIYAIALPDMPQFRGLWDRLPDLAKKRTEISALFVDEGGTVRQVY